MKRTLAILVLIAIILSPNDHRGYLYPNGSTTGKIVYLGVYGSEAKCIEAAHSHSEYTASSDFECVDY